MNNLLQNTSVSLSKHALKSWLASLGVADDRALAAGVRDGSLAGDHVVRAIAESAVDKLRVANPRWFPTA